MLLSVLIRLLVKGTTIFLGVWDKAQWVRSQGNARKGLNAEGTLKTPFRGQPRNNQF